MHPSELIGKKAIRTGPNSNGDYSYTDEPLLILAVTNSHIVYRHLPKTFLGKIAGEENRVFDCRWVDDDWTDYDELMALVPPPDEPEEVSDEPEELDGQQEAESA